MTLIPELERDLVQAAARASRRRRRRVGLAAVCAAAGAAIAIVLALAVANDSTGPSDHRSPAKQPAPPARCTPGKPPTGARAWRRLDRRPVRSLTVLGCARLGDGRQVELVIRKFRGRGRCFDIDVPAERAALECAAGPLPDAKAPAMAVSAFSARGTPAARRLGGALVAGWATGDVGRMQLHFGAADAGRRRELTLIRVTTVPLVLAAGEHTPFGIFVFKPPADLRGAKLLALTANGKRLGFTALPPALRKGS
jgi:hypothetical protein